MTKEFDWGEYPHFSEKEFKCSHTGKCEMDSDFLDILQRIRYAYGKPLVISSGYRDSTHPIEARKSKPGEHTTGRCADIAISRAEAFELITLAVNLGITRLGVQQKGDGRFLHLGIGGEGFPTPAIWSY